MASEPQDGNENTKNAYDGLILLRVRTTLYFWHQGTAAGGGAMTQFWEGVLADKQRGGGRPDLDSPELQAALVEYAVLHERNTNRFLCGSSEWDGALYQIVEAAATPLLPDDADAKGLKVSQGEWRPAREGTQATALAATDRLQAMESVAGWRSAYHGKFDFGGQTSVTTGMTHGSRQLTIDPDQVLAVSMAGVVNGY